MSTAVDNTQELIAHILNTSNGNSVVHEVIAKMRKAAADPSPLSRLIEDPAIVKLSRLKRQGKLKGAKNVPSARKFVIEEEEFQLGRLKALLRCAADHLEHEVRRADEAEVLAQYSECQEKEVLTKYMAAEIAKSQAETELHTSMAESQRFQLELQRVECELQQLKVDLHRVEKLRDGYEKATINAEEVTTQYRKKLHEYRSRERESEGGHRVELLNTLDEGREEGWIKGEEDGLKEGRVQGRIEGKNIGKAEGFKEGRIKGYEEGRQAGRTEGLVEGRTEGRLGERRRALEAFNKFLEEERGQDDKSARIRKWAGSVYYSGTVSIPSRSPSPERVTTEL